MPVNSFEHYPMSWKPERIRLSAPLYRSLAWCLEEDIAAGILAPNTKLPPQRELADYLDINLSTVTRAFKLCELKGLLYASIGRGTFVSSSSHVSSTIIEEDPAGHYIEMGIIKPYYQFNGMVADIAKEVVSRSLSDKLFEYAYPLGTPSQKQTAINWLSRYDIKAEPDNLAVASGAQNALTVALLALFKPGDKIATDPYTYPNFKSLANLLRLQLIPVMIDDKGMMPDALDNLCKLSHMDGLYLMPSCTNPTGTIIDNERRRELAAVIRKHKLLLIEDDNYTFLSDSGLTPLFNLIPQQGVYISSISKSLCAGLRIAYLTYPEQLRTVMENSIFSVNVKTSSLNSEIAAELIRSGTADEILRKKQELQLERNNVYAGYFPASNRSGNPLSLFRWLRLPEYWNGKEFELLAKRRGVQVYCSERFAVGNLEHYPAIRIALSSPADTEELRRGLSVLRELIGNSPASN